MKKLIALLLAVVMVCSFAACAKTPAAPSTEATTPSTEAPTESTGTEVKVMTYEEYMAAELKSVVTVETYVQGKQSWWDNKATIYTQAEDGAYFLYEMPCTEELYNKLTVGTKIRVTGIKAEWDGEIEITSDPVQPAVVEIIEGTWVATATDVTAQLGTDDLIKHQNKLVSFKGLTIEKISYKNDEPGDDIYVDFTKDGKTYSFCVERYLTGPDTEVYKAIGDLKVGDVVDVEGFLYWWQGPNTHITSIKPAA